MATSGGCATTAIAGWSCKMWNGRRRSLAEAKPLPGMPWEGCGFGKRPGCGCGRRAGRVALPAERDSDTSPCRVAMPRLGFRVTVAGSPRVRCREVGNVPDDTGKTWRRGRRRVASSGYVRLGRSASRGRRTRDPPRRSRDRHVGDGRMPAAVRVARAARTDATRPRVSGAGGARRGQQEGSATPPQCSSEAAAPAVEHDLPLAPDGRSPAA